ncbi:MAG: hypothetical protein NTW66_02745 [Candidatus Magasanikbacteria bacterium]|nr:hypothetical protein [Candidatus Magasanikbacteria bacterium]
MIENNKNNLEEKVMSQIKTGRVKLRSKYIFLAEKLGLGSAVALSVLLAVLFFNLVLFYLKASDNIGYLSFGSRGLYAFLESFPFALAAGLVILVLVAAFIIKRSGFLYNKPFGRIAVGLVIFIMALGIILTYTSLAEQLERHAYGPNPSGMFFRPLFNHGLDERGRGTTGRVVELNDNIISIQTPHGIEKIDISKLKTLPEQELKVGSFVMAIGEKKGDIFEPENIRVVNEDEMPMIRRGVHRRFGSFEPPMPLPPGIGYEGCAMNDCPMGGSTSAPCEAECFSQ